MVREVVVDPQLGEGVRLGVGRGELARWLEVFPDAGMARVSTPGLTMELKSIDGLHLLPNGVDVRISKPRGELWFMDSGSITLWVYPVAEDREDRKADLEKPSEVVAEAEPSAPVPPDSSPAAEGEVVASLPAGSEPTPPRGTVDQEPRERVTLTGRIGASPSIRTTPKGVLVLKFPLAVHDSEKTTWHTVLAFGDRAQRLQTALQKGQAVEVIGYRHLREAHTRKGEVRQVEEIYAVAVKTR